MHLSYLKTIPPLSAWKNCLPQSQSMVPKRLWTSVYISLTIFSFQAPLISNLSVAFGNDSMKLFWNFENIWRLLHNPCLLFSP